MGKLAGIKGKSPEAYPPDNPGKPSISTQSSSVGPAISFGTVPVSLLPDGPIEAGDSGERVIVMYSGVLQWANSDESPAAVTVTVGIYLDGAGSPDYSISVFVPSTNFNPPAGAAEPTPFSLFWETPENSAHTVDVKANTVANGCYASSRSIVLISTPV